MTNTIPAKMQAGGPLADPRLLLLDHGLAAGGSYRWRTETFRLETVHPDGIVDLRSRRTNALLSLRNADGSMSAPTVEWMRKAHADHELFAIGPVPEDAGRRQARALLVGATASSEKERRARWSFRLAWRAMAAELTLTDDAVGTWLQANYGLEAKDLEYSRPSASSLRRWMRRLAKGEMRMQSLVSTAGRPRNHSQLHQVVDSAVSEAALYFYSSANLKQVHAHAHLDDLLNRINDGLPEGASRFPLPSHETLRKRIRKLECFDTWASKYGREAALAKFQGNGEPLLVDHVLELGLMDATELEQVILFDEAWAIPALKCRITLIMDVLSHAIYGWCVYPGPNRAETSAQAYMHCMRPDKFPASLVEQHPDLLLLHGRFASILPDNEKALIGPETVAGYNECGTVVIPAPVAMPTAKAALERFIRDLKEALALLPGTMIDPRRAMEIGYDATKAAELTLAELRYHVARVIGDHNVSRATGPFGRSPVEIVRDRIATRATPAFEDPETVRRALCRTFPVFVTKNGVQKDTIRYRDAAALDRLIDDNRGRLARKAASEGFRARGRRNDGDIDVLEVLNEHTGAWVPLPSTEPGYTAGTSYWEHLEYKKAAKRLRLPFSNQRQRLAVITATREDRERLLPKARFQRRSKMAALAMSKKARELSGRPFVLSETDDIAPQAVLPRVDDPSLRGTSMGRGMDEADGFATSTVDHGKFDAPTSDEPAGPETEDDEDDWDEDFEDDGGDEA